MNDETPFRGQYTCAMADVLLAPTREELGDYEASYADLTDDLRSRGFDIEVLAPTPKRGLEQTAADLVVQLGEFAAGHLDDVIVGVITAKLAGLKRRPKHRARRTALIYGPDGKLLKEVELSGPEAAPPPTGREIDELQSSP
jgi:hypothetical protein